jgi:hypothetical protein
LEVPPLSNRNSYGIKMDIVANIGDDTRHPTGKGRGYSTVPVFVGSIEHIARLIQFRHHSASLVGSRLMARLSYASLDVKGIKRAWSCSLIALQVLPAPGQFSSPPLASLP